MNNLKLKPLLLCFFQLYKQYQFYKKNIFPTIVIAAIILIFAFLNRFGFHYFSGVTWMKLSIYTFIYIITER